VSLDEIESLIFDEADKLLDMGFKAEIQEIVDLTNSGSRQTLLFSATLGKDVQKIIRISLNKPLVQTFFLMILENRRKP
jgi:superfamily II DNA/RNA helicase